MSEQGPVFNQINLVVRDMAAMVEFYQRLGVGRRMMDAVCQQLDVGGEIGWLETDKPQNVVFYRRHGFDVAVEDGHLGFPIWFMRRPAR